MKLSGKRIEQFLDNPDPEVRAVLVYGPDAGLVRERVESLIASVAGDPGDPFRVADLSADEIAKDPARLADEAAAIAMTGGRRAVRLRQAGDAVSEALDHFLAEVPGDSVVVLEAGDLPPRSRLRKAVEGARLGVALPCYRDDGRSLEALIDEMLHRAGLRVSPEARAYLTANLGGDRQLTRRELEKLVLYMGPDAGREVSLADAQACVGDTAGADLVAELVVHFDVEQHPAAVDFGDRCVHIDPHIDQRRAQMIDLDPRADRILAVVEMGIEQILAGALDVEHHRRRGVDAEFFTHEADRAAAVDGDALGDLKARL